MADTEAQRLEALQRYGVLDTPPEREFDDLAKLASLICRTPFAAISLIDADRRWFKATVGLLPTEDAAAMPICSNCSSQLVETRRILCPCYYAALGSTKPMSRRLIPLIALAVLLSALVAVVRVLVDVWLR